MKRFIAISAMALFTVGAVSAHALTAEQAWSRVAGTRNLAQKVRGISNDVPKLVNTVNLADGKPAYYTFNTGDRTVFVSADNVAAPVLGYTEAEVADLNQIPPAMAYMLDTYAREIEWARAQGLQSDYTRSGVNDREAVPPLVTTRWNQDSPYNDLCPYKKGIRTYTGCVATAMTQAMGYYRYPVIGHGTAEYSWENQTLSVDLSESPIRWNDILPTYTESEPGTESQRSAIAALMRDCGYALHMKYGLAEDNGSDAYVYNIPHVLVNNYDYDKGVRCEHHIFYSQTEWERMMYDELSASRPIVYAGRGEGGGHAFICDGYQGNGLFHINWGWNGKSDGYFALSALDPYTLGAGGGSGGFNKDQQAVIGIQLPQPESVAPVPYVGITTDISASAIDYRLKIRADDDGSLSGTFHNLGREEAAFTFGVKLVRDGDGGTIFLTDNKRIDLLCDIDKGPAFIEVNVPSDLQGDYKAYPVYKYGDGDWEDVRLPYNGKQYIRLSVTPSLVDINPDDRSGDLTVISCNVPSTLVLNQDYSIELVIRNLTDSPQSYSCYAVITDEDVPHYPFADLGEVNGTIEPRATSTVSLKGKLDDSVITTKLPAGEYILLISCTRCENWNPEIPVTISAASGVIVNEMVDTILHEPLLYNLSGHRVSPDNLVPGVYVKVTGATKEKVLIKHK